MEDPRETILGRLESSRFATVTELSSLLGVSTVTIRRYLQILEQEGLVRRTRGGAFAAPKGTPAEVVSYYEGIFKKTAEDPDFKKGMGDAASSSSTRTPRTLGTWSRRPTPPMAT